MGRVSSIELRYNTHVSAVNKVVSLGNQMDEPSLT